MDALQRGEKRGLSQIGAAKEFAEKVLGDGASPEEIIRKANALLKQKQRHEKGHSADA